MPETMEEMLIIVVIGIRSDGQFATVHQTISDIAGNPGIFRGAIFRIPQLVRPIEGTIVVLVVEKVRMGWSILCVEKRRTKHEKAQDKRK